MKTGASVGAKSAIGLLLFLFVLAYPFIVYLHIDTVSPGWYGAVLLVVVLLRFIFLANKTQFNDYLLLIVAVVFCCLVMLLDSAVLLKFYPVLMNAGMGLMFIGSLRGSETLIEKFAKAGGKTPPDAARGYLRVLTLCWGILLLLNAGVSAYTAWFTSMSTWALYNGVVSYLVIAGFAALEWAYRGYYKKRHNIVDN